MILGFTIPRPGSCTSESQLKVNCRPKVNCRIKFGLARPTVDRPAVQFLSYNSLLVYNSLSAAIHLTWSGPIPNWNNVTFVEAYSAVWFYFCALVGTRKVYAIYSRQQLLEFRIYTLSNFFSLKRHESYIMMKTRSGCTYYIVWYLGIFVQKIRWAALKVWKVPWWTIIEEV